MDFQMDLFESFSEPKEKDSEVKNIKKKDFHRKENFCNFDFTENTFKNYSFEKCLFTDCNFYKADFENVTFTDCIFKNCNLSLIKCENTSFDGACFKSCKFTGVDFTTCNAFIFYVDFELCHFQSSTFSNSLKKHHFLNCKIQDTDFLECDLSEVDFSGTTFENVNFEKSNLEKADFSEAYNYYINPFTNKIKNAVFSLPDAKSFFDFLNITIQ